MILAVAWAKQKESMDQEAFWCQKNGIEEWCWRTREQSRCRAPSSTYEKPLLQED